MKPDIQAAVSLLQEMSPFEGTEVGETWELLARSWESYRDYFSEPFVKVLEKNPLAVGDDFNIF